MRGCKTIKTHSRIIETSAVFTCHFHNSLNMSTKVLRQKAFRFISHPQERAFNVEMSAPVLTSIEVNREVLHQC